MPVVTSPLRRPSRTSSRCRCRVAVPQPSGRRPAEMVISFAQRSGCRAANTTPTMPPRLAPTQVTGHRAAAAVEPCGDQIGKAGHRNGFVRVRIVEALPRRSVARPRRAEHGVLRGIDQIRRAQRRPPRRSRIVAFRLAVAERKRRRGDAADDQDDRRGAELGAVDPAAKLHIFERAPLDRDREMFDDQPPRTQVGGCKSGHRGIV